MVISQQAEECFRQGMRLLDGGQFREALSFFRSSFDQDLRQNGKHTQARYLSYYGLCLCVLRTDFKNGLRYCRTATEMEGYCPMIWWNLGRVAWLRGRRSVAHRAFRQALALEPDHAGVQRDLEKMGIRREPTMSFLAREHPVNVCFGKLRARVKGRVRAVVQQDDRRNHRTATGNAAKNVAGAPPPIRRAIA
jgi:tetratricopeptide (TPR) repeat protein